MHRINHFLTIALLALSLMSLAACSGSSHPAAGQAGQTAASPAKPAQAAASNSIAAYRLGSGDDLRITVFGEDSMTGTYKVDGTGAISLPLIGNVQAGGLTVADLQTSIAQHLAQGFVINPRVSVQVMNYRPFFILGEVNRPNQYAYVEGMKVINAVAMAGGYTYRADEDDMKIIRGNDPSRTKQSADPNTVVLPGDTIQIDERYF
jgi:polysaccharide export outer membrane protein